MFPFSRLNPPDMIYESLQASTQTRHQRNDKPIVWINIFCLVFSSRLLLYALKDDKKCIKCSFSPTISCEFSHFMLSEANFRVKTFPSRCGNLFMHVHRNYLVKASTHFRRASLLLVNSSLPQWDVAQSRLELQIAYLHSIELSQAANWNSFEMQMQNGGGKFELHPSSRVCEIEKIFFIFLCSTVNLIASLSNNEPKIVAWNSLSRLMMKAANSKKQSSRQMLDDLFGLPGWKLTFPWQSFNQLLPRTNCWISLRDFAVLLSHIRNRKW
jgi:hypothetical protein